MSWLVEIKQYYEDVAERFDRERIYPWTFVRCFIRKLSKKIMSHPFSVLEIGCGNGYNLKFAQRFGFEVAGCDISPKLVEICKKKNLNVIEGNALKLPYEDASFDAVMCISVLHHIPQEHHAKVFSEIKRVCPSGKCIIICMKHDVENDMIDGQRIFKYRREYIEEMFCAHFGGFTFSGETDKIVCVENN